MKTSLCAIGIALIAAQTHAAEAPRLPVRAFFADPQYQTVRMSPGGHYLGVITPHEGRDILVFIDLNTRKIKSSFRLTGWYADVGRFSWVNDDRVVIESAQKYDGYDGRYFSGELYATNADGTKRMPLVGSNIASQQTEVARMMQSKSRLATFSLLDPLIDVPGEALLVARYAKPDGSTRWSRPIAERVDVYTGRTRTDTKSPIEGGRLSTDPKGNVWVAQGVDHERQKEAVFVRPDPKGDWIDASVLIERFGDDAWIPGLAPDKRIYVVGQGPRRGLGLYVYDLATGAQQELYATDGVNVQRVIWSQDETRIVAVETNEASNNRKFLEPDEQHAKLLRMLQQSFPEDGVSITSETRDHSKAVVMVTNDRTDGDFYLFDVATKKVEFLFSRYPDLEPEALAVMKPFAFAARDGLQLHGYVTTPVGVSAKALPTIVLVHGGPHGIYDTWGFDREVQFYANRGYAVVQVNFRGSGGYGTEFVEMGYKRWGREMQDDVTDATRWAIAQGIADPDRICIAGGSYGAYSALMGVEREPDLYRCAIGLYGVYDLPLMFGRGDIPESKWGRDFLVKALGTDQADLVARSPISGVGKIKAALFLAHGGQDDRAHPQHFTLLRQALDKAGKPYSWHFEEQENHGYVEVDNRVELYTKIEAFLAEQLAPRPK